MLARLQGNFGYRNAYTENVDQWVEAHPIKPTAPMLARAVAAIDRVLGENSELRELWNESAEGGDTWRTGVEDLRRRLSASA